MVSVSVEEEKGLKCGFEVCGYVGGLKSLTMWQMSSSCMLDTGMSTSGEGYMKVLKKPACVWLKCQLVVEVKDESVAHHLYYTIN